MQLLKAWNSDLRLLFILRRSLIDNTVIFSWHNEAVLLEEPLLERVNTLIDSGFFQIRRSQPSLSSGEVIVGRIQHSFPQSLVQII